MTDCSGSAVLGRSTADLWPRRGISGLLFRGLEALIWTVAEVPHADGQVNKHVLGDVLGIGLLQSPIPAPAVDGSAVQLDMLVCHSWPGNIRELQHVIERTVILSDGPVLRTTSLPLCPTSETEPLTLKDSERAHILVALRRTNWVVGGRTGAAAQLGVKRTTLIAKMQRLCLSREPAHLQPA